MAAKKKVTKKADSTPRRRVVKDAEIDNSANNEARDSKDASKGGKPKIHAKVVHLIVSVGTHDRDRTHEEFVADLMKKLGKVPYGTDGIHASVSGGYYILDGKVCEVENYDTKKGTFKKGTYPPSWAGGTKPTNVKTGTQQEQMQRDLKELSSDEYDKKYGLGKHSRFKSDDRLITPDMQKKRLEEWRKEKQRKEEAEIEEILGDDDAVSEIVDESASAMVRKMKSKKRVIKKPAPKKTGKKVRRIKK